MRSLLFLTIAVLVTACSPGTELETLAPRQGEIREFFQEPARICREGTGYALLRCNG